MTMTVPEVARFSILGHWTNGHAMDCVFDFQVDVSGSAEDRADVIATQAGNLVSQWQSEMVPNFADNYTVDGVHWVDLDSEDGSTGDVGVDPGEASSGGVVNASITPNVSLLVKKVITGSRGSRSGRFYCPPTLESSIDENGVIDGAFLTPFQTSCDNFLEGTKVSIESLEVTRMVVVHLDPRPTPPAPDNRVGTFSVVSALQAQSTVATQRRRLRS